MRYRSSFDVPVSATVAFDYLADGANSLSFHPPGTKVAQEPRGDIGLGTRFVFDRPGGPGFASTISRFEPPERLEFESAFDGQAPTIGRWSLSPLGSGTRLMVETDSSFVGPRWVRPFVGVLTLGAWPLLMITMWRFKRRLASALEAAAKERNEA